MSKGRRVDSILAARIATRIMLALDSSCHKIKVAGSIRRNLPKVGDIDIVLSPRMVVDRSATGDLFDQTKRETLWPGLEIIRQLGARDLLDVSGRAAEGSIARKREVTFSEMKVVTEKPAKSMENGVFKLRCARGEFSDSVKRRWDGIGVDIYVVEPRRFEMAMLIRTGSKEHNIRLAQQARRLGMKLRADCKGIQMPDRVTVPINSEEEAFDLLELKYLPPELRDSKAAAR